MTDIKIANAIISDLTRESKFAFKPGFLQTVYVNVRNPRNLGRVLWTSEDKARYPQIKVVLFGESTDLYSYSRIIDDSVDASCSFDKKEGIIKLENKKEFIYSYEIKIEVGK